MKKMLSILTSVVLLFNLLYTSNIVSNANSQIAEYRGTITNLFGNSGSCVITIDKMNYANQSFSGSV